MSVFEAAFAFSNSDVIPEPDSAALALRFRELVTAHELILSSHGLKVRKTSTDTFAQFGSASTDRKKQILTTLKFQNDALSEKDFEFEIGQPVSATSSQFSRDKELPYFMTALRKAGLRLGDASIIQLIEDEDIIEIFDAHGVQLYRSWSCYKHCLYSLAELLVYDWDTLYIRPSWVAKELYELAPKVFGGQCGTVPFGFPEYAMTERLMKSDRTLLYQMKYTSPLVCQDTRQILACVCTGRIRSVPNVNSDQQIHMI